MGRMAKREARVSTAYPRGTRRLQAKHEGGDITYIIARAMLCPEDLVRLTLEAYPDELARGGAGEGNR